MGSPRWERLHCPPVTGSHASPCFPPSLPVRPGAVLPALPLCHCASFHPLTHPSSGLMPSPTFSLLPASASSIIHPLYRLQAVLSHLELILPLLSSEPFLRQLAVQLKLVFKMLNSSCLPILLLATLKHQIHLWLHFFFFFNSSNIVLSLWPSAHRQVFHPPGHYTFIFLLPGIPFAASAHYNQPYPSLKTKCKICPVFGKKSLTFRGGGRCFFTGSHRA